MPSAIIGGATAIGGALLSNKAAKDSQKAQQQAMAAATTTLDDFAFNTPLGAGATNTGLQSRLDLGLGQTSATNLTQFANNQSGQLLGQGLPPGVQQALAQLQGIQGPQADPTLNFLQGGFGQQFNQAGDQFNLRQLQSLGGPEQVRNRELDLLRQQAQPFEDRAFQNLQESQFATGRAGTSGGGLQTEAFARGLAQADTGRQLAATQVGQQQQGLQESLLQGAFGRFAGLGQLTSDVGQQRFGQQLGAGSFQQGLQGQNFQQQVGAAGLPAGLQGSQIQNILSALQGQSGLQGQSLDLFNAGLQRSIAAANARVGAGSNIAAIAGSKNFNPGASSDFLGSVLTGVGQRVGGTSSGGGVVSDILGGIFNFGGGK